MTKDKGTWPVTSDDDGSLSMTPEAAEEFMKPDEAEEEPEAADDGGDDDDDLDDLA